MREIKFRAWDLDQKQYVTEYDTGDYGEVHFIGKSVEVYYKELTCHCGEGCGGCDDEWVLTENGIELEQFTGLQDKNGVDIYEGDILGFTHKLEVEDGVVQWVDHGFMLVAPGEHMRSYHWPSICEVIGHIHDE